MKHVFLFTIIILAFASCKKEEPTVNEPPIAPPVEQIYSRVTFFIDNNDFPFDVFELYYNSTNLGVIPSFSSCSIIGFNPQNQWVFIDDLIVETIATQDPQFNYDHSVDLYKNGIYHQTLDFRLNKSSDDGGQTYFTEAMISVGPGSVSQNACTENNPNKLNDCWVYLSSFEIN